ncbi:MAG: MarR family winged helix-turn-helix transcriptional regulator [Oscillospiraceae bacterium]
MAHSDEPSCCETHILPLLSCAYHKGQRYMDRRLRRYDVTPAQAHTLRFLLRETPRREVNQRDLEEFLRIRPSTVSGIVERLEQKGFLLRTPSRTDARRRALTLTDRGRAFQADFCAEANAAERHIASLFTEEEYAQLRRMLQRIITSLQSEEEEPC